MTSYCQIMLTFKSASYGFRVGKSLWKLTGDWAERYNRFIDWSDAKQFHMDQNLLCITLNPLLAIQTFFWTLGIVRTFSVPSFKNNQVFIMPVTIMVQWVMVFDDFSWNHITVMCWWTWIEVDSMVFISNFLWLCGVLQQLFTHWQGILCSVVS